MRTGVALTVLVKAEADKLGLSDVDGDENKDLAEEAKDRGAWSDSLWFDETISNRSVQTSEFNWPDSESMAELGVGPLKKPSPRLVN